VLLGHTPLLLLLLLLDIINTSCCCCWLLSRQWELVQSTGLHLLLSSCVQQLV
jgi:hypothetical protein